MRVDIKDHRNIPIGYTQDQGSMLQGFHLKQGYVGYYNKNTNITFTKAGNIYCFGDGIQCIIRDVDRGIKI